MLIFVFSGQFWFENIVTICHATYWFSLLFILVLCTHMVIFGRSCRVFKTMFTQESMLHSILITICFSVICGVAIYFIICFLAWRNSSLHWKRNSLSIIKSKTTLVTSKSVIFNCLDFQLVSLNNFITIYCIWSWILGVVVHERNSLILHHLWIKIRIKLNLWAFKNRAECFLSYGLLILLCRHIKLLITQSIHIPFKFIAIVNVNFRYWFFNT